MKLTKDEVKKHNARLKLLKSIIENYMHFFHYKFLVTVTPSTTTRHGCLEVSSYDVDNVIYSNNFFSACVSVVPGISLLPLTDSCGNIYYHFY